jgi:hypothetical protein
MVPKHVYFIVRLKHARYLELLPLWTEFLPIDVYNLIFIGYLVSERGSIYSGTIYLGTCEYFISLNIVVLCALTTDKAQQKFLNSELQRLSRSEEIMMNFGKAL